MLLLLLVVVDVRRCVLLGCFLLFVVWCLLSLSSVRVRLVLLLSEHNRLLCGV